MKTELSRRGLLAVGLGTLVLGGCRESLPGGRNRGAASASRGLIAPPPPASSPAPHPSPPPRRCGATEDNIEGPYYRPGAPFRKSLLDPTTLGAPLCLRGHVLSLDCRSPIADAVLDVWQADGDGHYDNDGSLSLPADAFRMRGKVACDAKGEFELWTLVPGRYLNGRSYRPAHIHVKLAAAGHQPLTTQLYFPDDPYNASDPFIRRSLIMDVERASFGTVAQYDFVLLPA